MTTACPNCGEYFPTLAEDGQLKCIACGYSEATNRASSPERIEMATGSKVRNHRIVVAVALLTLGLIGCGGPNAALVDAADHFVNVSVGPDYEGYVNADPTLDEVAKRSRLTNVQTFRDAVAAAKGN